MARLIVPEIDEELVQALNEQAARHGRSAEAELREILREALTVRQKKSFKELLLEIPAVDDSFFERRRDRPRDVEL